MSLNEEQIKDIDNDICPECGEEDSLAFTCTAPEKAFCDKCGWWEFEGAINAQRKP